MAEGESLSESLRAAGEASVIMGWEDKKDFRNQPETIGVYSFDIEIE